MNRAAKIYFSAVLVLAVAVAVMAGGAWHSTNPPSWLKFLILAVAASIYKVKLPRIDGTYSLNFIFILVAVAKYGLGEAIVIGCTAVAVQCLWKRKNRPTVVQFLFNVASMAITVTAAFYTNLLLLGEGQAFSMTAAAIAYFAVNTYLIASMMALSSGQYVQKIWQEWFVWSFPYFAVGAAIATAEVLADDHASAKVLIASLPICYLVFCYYRAILRARDEHTTMRRPT